MEGKEVLIYLLYIGIPMIAFGVVLKILERLEII